MAPLHAPVNFVSNHKTFSQPRASPMSAPAYISIVTSWDEVPAMEPSAILPHSTLKGPGKEQRRRCLRPLCLPELKARWPDMARGHLFLPPFCLRSRTLCHRGFSVKTPHFTAVAVLFWFAIKASLIFLYLDRILVLESSSN